jgi:hypothetical protein
VRFGLNVLGEASGMAHIFPTRSRTKHSKLQSYPIGAEALSRALDGVPQHDQIACDFYAGNPNADKAKDIINVMSVVYEKHARTFHHSEDADERGVFDPRWTIHIYAVATDLRAQIKTALLEIGLPDFTRTWLIDHAHLTGKTGGAALWLAYDTTEKCLLATRKTGLQPDRA